MIFCLKDKDNVYVAYDEAQSYIVGLSKEDKQLPANILLINPKKNIILASNSMRLIDILRYEDIYDFAFTYEEINLTFTKKVKELAFQYKLVEEFGMLPGSIIIAKNDQAYGIDTYGLVEKVMDFMSIETNTFISKYIVNTYKDIEPLEIIKKVYKAKTTYLGTNVFPVYVMDTSSNNLTIIE